MLCEKVVLVAHLIAAGQYRQAQIHHPLGHRQVQVVTHRVVAGTVDYPAVHVVVHVATSLH